MHNNLEIDNFILKQDNIDSFLDNIPMDMITESDETFNVMLDVNIDNTIEQLERILKLEALSDEEWEELHASDDALQEDIEMLNFDSAY